MDLNLKGHVALVQGASKGIGRGIACALADEGCDLVLTARTKGPLDDLAKELGEKGVRVVALPMDSADLDAIPEAVKMIDSTFGRLDILLCNSGGPKPGEFTSLNGEDWALASQLLIASPATLLQQSLGLLKNSPAPRFFIVTSSSTKMPVPGLTLSNVFRPGIVGLIKTLSDELGGTGLRCHSIAPGRFDTDRLGNLMSILAEKQGTDKESVREQMIQPIPAGRLGDPLDIGKLVAFLSSPLADYLNGQNWMVDGGLVKSI